MKGINMNMKFGVWTKTVDENPPEPEIYKSGYYLCTIVNNQVVALTLEKNIVRGKEVVRWYYNDCVSHWDVIAWMPYPEAYKEK